MFIFGWGHRTIKDFGTDGEQVCPVCNNKIDMRRIRITTWFTFWFIPVIPYHRVYVVACPICKNSSEVSKDHFATDDMTEADREKNKYVGKTETQIAYLKEMEAIQKEKMQRDL